MKQDKTGKLGQNAPGSSDAASAARLGQTVADAALARGGLKCTPGPWEVQTPPDRDDPDWSDEYPRGISVRSHWEPPRNGTTVGYEICTMSGVSSETLPNAYLIAAALYMYEALEAIVRKFDDRYVGALYSELIAARAALAKARGEKPESTSTAADEGAQAATRSQNK